MLKGKNQIYKKLTMSLSPTLKRPVYYSECRSRSLFIRFHDKSWMYLLENQSELRVRCFIFLTFFPLCYRKTLKSMFSTWITTIVEIVVFFCEWIICTFFLIIETSNIHVFEFSTKIWLLFDFSIPTWAVLTFLCVWKTHFFKTKIAK